MANQLLKLVKDFSIAVAFYAFLVYVLMETFKKFLPMSDRDRIFISIGVGFFVSVVLTDIGYRMYAVCDFVAKENSKEKETGCKCDSKTNSGTP